MVQPIPLIACGRGRTAPSIASSSRCGISTTSAHALNPAASADLALFTAVLRGEHTLRGFRDREVRTRLFDPTASTDHRRSAQISRLVKRLPLRGLVAKIPARGAWRIRGRETS